MRMLDSIFAQNLPPGADAYLGYPDGQWPTVLDLRAKFPGARILSVAVFPADDAEGLDVENGDATVPEVYDWLTRQQKRKVWRPVLYISAGRAASLLATMSANGFHRSSFRLLTAHYNAGRHICGPSSCGYPAADGTQWTDSAAGEHGSLIDESLLLPDFFGTPPPPSPKPHLRSMSGDDMFYLPNGAGAVATLPVPAAVPQADGTFVPPVALRLCTNAACEVETQQDQGNWSGVIPVDYNRGPNLVALHANTSEIKVKRVDGGSNLIVADFA